MKTIAIFLGIISIFCSPTPISALTYAINKPTETIDSILLDATKNISTPNYYPAQTASFNVTVEPTTNPPTSSYPPSNSFTKVIVSFGSVCCGIDENTRRELVSFVQSKYPEVKVADEDWGEEGETTYTFFIESLSPQAKDSFVTSIKQMVEQGRYIVLEITDKKGNRQQIYRSKQ